MDIFNRIKTKTARASSGSFAIVVSRQGSSTFVMGKSALS
jgi:hypothetical protein